MARVNTKPIGPRTFEGGPAVPANAEQQLRRTLLACMLWEDTFYESGEDVAARIKSLARAVAPDKVAALAIEAREQNHLRHAPLLLARELARHPGAKGKLVGDTIARVIQRPDELAEFLAMYWSEAKQPLAKQVKRGLALAFQKFDGYQLAKYNRDDGVKLRDVLFLSHAKPLNPAQADLWKRLVDGKLSVPDTWEVALSGGADKKATFERLLHEKKLGYMALLRNLRNMEQAGVSRELVTNALRFGAARSRALPFRFIAALRAAPAFAQALDEAMLASMAEMPKLPGSTVVLVDVSYSMRDKLSEKSDLTRMDAGAALAALVRGVAEDCRVFTFSEQLIEVPAFQGGALCAAIPRSQKNSGTRLGKALEALNAHLGYDRIIVLTDEQSHDRVGSPNGRGYMVNVASYQNGVGYGDWVRVNGFSEAVVSYIRALEAAGFADERAEA